MKLKNYKPKPHLSPTSAINFARCPRLYFYKNGCNLRTSDITPIPLTFGSAIHAGLPLAYDDLDGALSAFHSVWQDTEGDEKRNPRRAELMFANFYQFHQRHNVYTVLETPHDENYELVSRVSPVEQPFAFDIGTDHIVVGKIDNCGRHTASQKVFAIEYKTTSELSSRFLNSFLMNMQVFTYALALNISGTEECAGTIVEAIRVAKPLKSGANNTETVAYPISVPHHQHEETIKWYQGLSKGISKCERDEDFPMNQGMCNPYGAYGTCGYNCPYIELCQQEDWTDLYDAFVVEERKPFIIEKGKQVE